MYIIKSKVLDDMVTDMCLKPFSLVITVVCPTKQICTYSYRSGLWWDSGFIHIDCAIVNELK